ncbi:tRNA pseudouridine(55) synthase TruB [Propionibacteriaceae bacterium Y1685]|uniref:tRNA pseudouridine(55) synthase TruB n=1 Tax=Microlunatus sp. Y1700 TaxID=3418487 RepID=UPI003B7BF3B2
MSASDDPRPGTSRSGIVVVDKPAGLTSHQVVSRVRRAADTRKVGHAGTLDPMATGVLVLGVNRATRLLGHLMVTDKSYTGTIRLGASTVTDDAEGEVINTADTSAITETMIRAAIEPFHGDIEQVPTQVSAIKINGVRSYARVRSGEEVELKARPVTVHRYDVAAVRRIEGFVDVDVEVDCTSGTYIRALARDLGGALGCGGHLTALRRTAVGPFTLDRSVTVDQLAERFSMINISEVAAETFPVVQVSGTEVDDVRHGRALPSLELSVLTAVFVGDEFLALYKPSGRGARAEAVFGAA